MEETTRLFVALRPPAATCARILEIQASLAEQLSSPLRRTRADQLHLTLFFAPAFPADKIESLRDSIKSICETLAPFAVELGPAEIRPSRGAPRILWMPVAAGVAPLTALHLRLQEAALAIDPSRPPASTGTFRPHLTLGRFPRGAPPHLTSEFRRQSPLSPPPPWKAAELELIASRLETGGARHTTLGHFSL